MLRADLPSSPAALTPGRAPSDLLLTVEHSYNASPAFAVPQVSCPTSHREAHTREGPVDLVDQLTGSWTASAHRPNAVRTTQSVPAMGVIITSRVLSLMRISVDQPRPPSDAGGPGAGR